MKDSLTQLQRYQKRKNALWNVRSEWDGQYKDLAKYFLPRAGRFDMNETRKGAKRFDAILDPTTIRGARIMSAGLMAGSSSPARPWFALSIEDKQLAEYAPVKLWLDIVAKAARNVFAKSNTYRSLQAVYEELVVFGTGVSLMQENYGTLIHHTPLTVGEYVIATDDLGNVSTLFRTIPMTVEQVVRKFGYDVCSTTVRNMYDSHNWDRTVEVIHAIEPRDARDISKADNKNMPFKSVYFEAGRNPNAFLRESGFKTFPGLAPRYAVGAGDAYGVGPGMEALGASLQLMQEQEAKGKGIAYLADPPLQAPASMKSHQMDLLPGGLSFYDGGGPHDGIRSAFNVQLNLQHLLADIQDVREGINQAFYVDLFMMLANDTRSNVTAREIAERHEEKLLMLGPVLERMHNELHSPLIDFTFEKMITATVPGGKPFIPPPPPELHGMDLKVEFVSTLAQAQRAVGTNAIDRLVMSIGQIVAIKPEIVDKLDGDQLVDAYADMLGVDPQIIVADDKVALIRQDRARQQQAAQMVQAAPMMADAAKKMGETDGQNIMNMFQGYGLQ